MYVQGDVQRCVYTSDTKKKRKKKLSVRNRKKCTVLGTVFKK